MFRVDERCMHRIGRLQWASQTTTTTTTKANEKPKTAREWGASIHFSYPNIVSFGYYEGMYIPVTTR